MDRGVWRATVHGIAKSQTRLSDRTHTHRTKLFNISETKCLYDIYIYIISDILYLHFLLLLSFTHVAFHTDVYRGFLIFSQAFVNLKQNTSMFPLYVFLSQISINLSYQ